MKSIQFHVPPFAANDQIANLGCVFAFFIQLVNQETLLETELSAGAVIGRVAIEQTAMAVALIAVAIARLQRE